MVGPVIFDTIKRYLTHSGYQVTFVINITRRDDKLIVKAAELGTSVKELAQKMTADYFDNLRRWGRYDRPLPVCDRLHRRDERPSGGSSRTGRAYAVDGDVRFSVMVTTTTAS
ncbi:MAG: hypothetical protein U0992_11140 [Planctomycetaceae bacterium]